MQLREQAAIYHDLQHLLIHVDQEEILQLVSNHLPLQCEAVKIKIVI